MRHWRMRDSAVRHDRRALLRTACLASAAAVLGCAEASGGQTPPMRAEDRFFTTSDGVRLHYLDAGRGRTILFIPGWSMPAFIWQRQIAALSPRWRTVAMDPRSQGRSQVARSGHEPTRRGRDIGEIIERLGADRVVLVGWSLGVLDSLAYLHETGDRRIAGLVLVDNSIGEGTPPPARPSTFFASLRRDREAHMRAFVRGMYQTPQDSAYLDSVTRAALTTPLETQIRLLSYPRPREYWREAVYSTRRPVLYAVRPRLAEQAEALRRNHADATIAMFEDAGHALFVDRAERFNATLEDFCARKAQWA